jgi:hypothetical protein
MLPSGQVENDGISSGKRVPAMLAGGPCSQAYVALQGHGRVRVRVVKQESLKC